MFLKSSSQPLVLSNWPKWAFSESISADQKSLSSFGQEDTSRSETRLLKRSKKASSRPWLKKCITWSHGKSVCTNTPTRLCTPVLTEAPSTLRPVILSWRAKIPIRSKAASMHWIIPSALALFAGSSDKNFKSDFPLFKNNKYTISSSITLVSVLPSLRTQNNGR